MAEKIVIPPMGMSFQYVTLTELHKQIGDTIKKGESIGVGECEKIVMELKSACDGTILQILYSVGDTIPVDATVAWIGEPGEIVPETGSENAPSELPAAAESTSVPPAAMPGPLAKKSISPAAKKLIEENNLDINEIEGTGPGGIISRKDVQSYLASIKTDRAPAASPPSPVAAPVTAGGVDAYVEEGDKVSLYAGIRKAIGDHLLNSLAAAPQVTTVVQVDMTDLLALRKRLAGAAEIKPSVVAFVIRAALLALEQYPALNSWLVDDHIICKKAVHMGVAVAGEYGLVVPVIRNAENMTVRQLSEAVSELADAGRTGALTPERMAGATLTLSNSGAFGAYFATPVINLPQSAMIWMGKAVLQPAVHKGEIVPRSVMCLVVTYDHRVIDGSVAGLFLTRMKELLEAPETVLIG